MKVDVKLRKFLVVFLCILTVVEAEEFEVYKEISDIYHPTIEDLQKIQHALLQSPRPELKSLWDTDFVVRNFKFIGDSPEEMPQYYHLAVNSNQDDRDNCVIIYASYNNRYPKGAQRLSSFIQSSDYIGHLHWRIGGWPDLNAGSIVLAHVPYAFKVCFFKEMQRMGYKRVLYMDSSILPLVSLNRFFEIIKEKGMFIKRNHLIDHYFMREETARYFGYSFEEACRLFCCHGCVVGIDFTNEKAMQLFDAWYEAAKDPYAYYSPRSDQTALSLLLHRLGITDWLREPYQNYFLIDRPYVKDY